LYTTARELEDDISHLKYQPSCFGGLPLQVYGHRYIYVHPLNGLVRGDLARYAQRAEKPKNDLKRRKEQKQPQLTGMEGKMDGSGLAFFLNQGLLSLLHPASLGFRWASLRGVRRALCLLPLGAAGRAGRAASSIFNFQRAKRM
jgi:hypothetical protein